MRIVALDEFYCFLGVLGPNSGLVNFMVLGVFYCFLKENYKRLLKIIKRRKKIGRANTKGQTKNRSVMFRMFKMVIICMNFGFEPTDLKVNRSRSLNLSIPGPRTQSKGLTN